MASTALRKEEGVGLVVAVALHAAVLAALLIRTPHHAVVIPPQRIEVTLSDEVGLTSTAPNPSAQAAPDKGPEAGEPAPAPEPQPAPVPPPEPVAPAPRAVEPPPVPRPAPAPKPAPRPAPKPAPRPVTKTPPKAPARQQPAPVPPRKSSAIDTIVSRPNRPAAPASKAPTPPKKGGSSSFADAFSDGVPGAKAPTGAAAPAAAIGPKQVTALVAAINRQLKPHWQVPQGAEADLLVTRLRFRLNRDGSLAGEPQVISTTGQTDANRAQVQRHQEQAVRAVKLSAPFNLPEDLYDGWKVVTTNFDRRLSQ